MAIAQAAQRQGDAGRLGKQVTERVLDWKPTIRIPSGTQVRISPIKTLQVC